MDELLKQLKAIKEKCKEGYCHRCIYRSEKGVNKCILNDIPELWNIKKLEENIRVAK